MTGSPEYDTPTKQAARPASLDSGVKIPNITLSERIGRGGYGAVYVGEHHILHTKVAVKVLNANPGDVHWTSRFQREAKALSKLSHPGIVKVLSFSLLENSHAAMVMEFVEGTNLQDLIDQGGALSAERSVNICKQLCDAVGYAHGLGIVHRDIKPSNIVITSDDRVKLLDFGIAKLFADETAAENVMAQKLTATGQFMGTPAFMSPEQCQGKQASPSSDIYALAGVLFFMLVGKPVFAGNSDAEIMLKHCDSAPELVQLDLPGDLISILAKALQKEPNNRFSSCEMFSRALADAALDKPQPKSKNQALRFIAVILAVCALIGILGTAYVSRTQQEQVKEARKKEVQRFKALVAPIDDAQIIGPKLKEAIEIELPSDSRYLKLKPLEILSTINMDELPKYSREMLAIVEAPAFSTAPISAADRLHYRIRALLNSADANVSDREAFNTYVERAEKLLSPTKTKSYLNLIGDRLLLFALRADRLRADKQFEAAQRVEQPVYDQLSTAKLTSEQIWDFANRGLRSCVSNSAPAEFSKLHRKELESYIFRSTGDTGTQACVLAGLIGNALSSRPQEVLDFARRFSQSTQYKDNHNNPIFAWTLVELYRLSIGRENVDLKYCTSDEITFLKRSVSELLPKQTNADKTDGLIFLASMLVRHTGLTSGLDAAARELDKYLACCPQGDIWKLRMIAIFDLKSVDVFNQSKSFFAERNKSFEDELKLAGACTDPSVAGLNKDQYKYYLQSSLECQAYAIKSLGISSAQKRIMMDSWKNLVVQWFTPVEVDNFDHVKDMK